MDLSFQITRKLLRFSNHVVNMRSERLRMLDLTTVQSETLMYFCRNEGSNATDLKNYLNVSHQAARSIVSRLKEKGLLYSSASDKDGRNRSIYPTDEGKRVYQSLVNDGSSAGEELLGALSDEEKEILNRLIDKLNAGF